MANITSDSSANFEVPREVFMSASETIADHLLSLDFKFARSGVHCRKVVGALIFQIAFDSSHHNVAGSRVNLNVAGTVFSPKLKKWRKAHPPLRDWNYVAGGNIGRLRNPSKYIEWDLADPRKRADVIEDVIESIKSLALPYFSRFEDIGRVVPFLIDHDLPAMDIDNVLEFLLCFADVNAARRAANRFLRERPDLLDDFHRAVRKFRTAGPGREPDENAEYLAYASLFLGLGKLTGAAD